MLKEIVLSAAFLIGNNVYSQSTNSMQTRPSSNDSLIIELLSKDYAIEDTTVSNGYLFPIKKRRLKAYEQLKENYKHPELVDLFINYLKSYGKDVQQKKIMDTLLKKIIKYNVKDSVTDLLLGEYHQEKGELDIAILYYELSIEKGLEFSETYRHIADIKFFNIDQEEFLRIKEHLESNNPTNILKERLENERNYLLKGLDEIETLYKKAIEFDSKNKPAYWHLAEVYELQGKYAQSLEEINKTFEIRPTELNDYLHRMLILEEMFENKNLSEDVKRAIKNRYLKDIDTSLSHEQASVLLYLAYEEIKDSDIFTEKEIKEFEEKYKETLETVINQDIPLIIDGNN